MKNTRAIFIVMATVVSLFILAACENSSEETSAISDNQLNNNNSSEKEKDDSSNAEAIENASTTGNTDTKEKEGASNHSSSKEEVPATSTIEASLKEEYVKKLESTKKETEEMEAADSSTYALKKVENDRWQAWDDLLNEIYRTLNDQLPPKEMDQLREEQRKWIKNRDDRALEASLKYEGGTQEHLEYVTVLANLTEERCVELVEDYIK
ncbi:DUF1311 domain-containing protein [Halobacillus salinarum]|uniref:DUF1311 domain-containing protein n=1 Tax=Halobacillus salinarum TaxID=2932257 RepID=A0ABY4EM05_9BACI|nr:lysozyme inhibitor LprI family protein [Halobacillus salinarum]UOQ44898.1 DUF1311 domain-containing protein [Halobacillus salinarum]